MVLRQAFIIGEEFIGGDDCALFRIISLRSRSPKLMDVAVNKESGATVFAYHVNDPERYGVVEIKRYGNKPEENRYNQKYYAVTGLYF